MNTTERVIDIMMIMASAGGPCGISEINRQLNIGKNNIYRILYVLEEKGWAWQDINTKKYGLTGALARVGLKAISHLDIQEVSLPYLRELQEATGETVALSIKEEMERTFINCIPSDYQVRHVVPIGAKRQLWYGSGGKAILAFMGEEEIKAILNQFSNSGVLEYESGQTTTVEAVREDLAQIRKQGFAVAVGERNPDACGVSVPIFNYKQEVIGSLSVSGPISRLNREKAIQFSTLVMEKARKISLALGADIE